MYVHRIKISIYDYLILILKRRDANWVNVFCYSSTTTSKYEQSDCRIYQEASETNSKLKIMIKNINK